MLIKDSVCFSYKLCLFTRKFERLFIDFYIHSFIHGSHMGKPKFAHIIAEKYRVNCLITINKVIKLQN